MSRFRQQMRCSSLLPQRIAKMFSSPPAKILHFLATFLIHPCTVVSHPELMLSIAYQLVKLRYKPNSGSQRLTPLHPYNLTTDQKVACSNHAGCKARSRADPLAIPQLTFSSQKRGYSHCIATFCIHHPPRNRALSGVAKLAAFRFTSATGSLDCRL